MKPRGDPRGFRLDRKDKGMKARGRFRIGPLEINTGVGVIVALAVLALICCGCTSAVGALAG